MMAEMTHTLYERSNLTRLQLLHTIGHKLRPESPLFNTIITFTISGLVDRAHFERAFQMLVEHTDALRTVIEENDGVLQQKVVVNPISDLEYLDFSSEPEAQATFQAWLVERSTRPLDLATSLFDAVLIKLSAEKFVWYLNQHHAITDASSFVLVYERLAAFYEAALKGKGSNLVDLPTFAQYVAFEQAYRNSPQYDKAAIYWQNKLSPGPEPIKFYGQKPNKKTTRVQRVSYDLGPRRSQKLRELANQKGIFTISQDLSLYNVFAALFFAHLHYLSGNHRLGTVTPVHNRFAERFSQTIGLVMEICPFQIEVNQDDTFRSLIQKVKRETREILTFYQYGSGLSLQSEAFDTMFNMHHLPQLKLAGMPVQMERIHPGYGFESLVLHVNDVEASDSFILHFDLHCDVFNQVQREQVVTTFVACVDLFLQDSAHPIGTLNLPVTNEQVERLPNGVLDCQAQMPPIGIKGDQVREFFAPRNHLEHQLVQIWEEVLEVSPIGVKDNFFDLGGNSWVATRLFLRIEEALGRSLPLSTLVQTATIEGIIQTLNDKTDADLWSPIVQLQPGTTGQPFFCAPGVGGDVLHLVELAHYLGCEQPFYAFQAPGLYGQQEPYTRLEDVAVHFIQAMRSVQPSGPYLLGGYSWGGMVAFEMAHQLQQQNEQITLFIIDIPAQSPYFKLLRHLIHLVGNLLRFGADKEVDYFVHLRDNIFMLNYWLHIKFRRLLYRYMRHFLYRYTSPFYHHLLPKEVRRKIKTHYRKRKRLKHATAEKSAGLKELVQVAEQNSRKYKAQIQLDPIRKNLVKINRNSVKEYIPQPYSGRVILFQSVKGLRSPEFRSFAPKLGWEKIVKNKVEVHKIPGDHGEIIREPYVQILAKQLRTVLDNIPG